MKKELTRLIVPIFYPFLILLILISCGGDGGETSAPSFPILPPVANAGIDQTVRSGYVVTLDGSGSSDANNDPLTYSWAFSSKPAGSSGTLSNATSVKPTFTPDVDGSYIFNLIVNNGKENSAASSVTIQATSDLSKLFSYSSSTSGIKINGYFQAVSQLVTSIKNVSNETFYLEREELTNGGARFSGASYSFPPLGPGQSFGGTQYLNSPTEDLGFVQKYFLLDGVTGAIFTVSITITPFQ